MEGKLSRSAFHKETLTSMGWKLKELTREQLVIHGLHTTMEVRRKERPGMGVYIVGVGLKVEQLPRNNLWDRDTWGSALILHL